MLIISGAVINACLMLIMNFPALRTYSRSPFHALFWEAHTFNRYPISIYPKFLQLIFTTIIPLAFVNYYPVQVLLGKQEGFGVPATIWLSPIVALTLFGLTNIIWNRILRFYESAGT
jgi:ABC-2 type transport system permease protein